MGGKDLTPEAEASQSEASALQSNKKAMAPPSSKHTAQQLSNQPKTTRAARASKGSPGLPGPLVFVKDPDEFLEKMRSWDPTNMSEEDHLAKLEGSLQEMASFEALQGRTVRHKAFNDRKRRLSEEVSWIREREAKKPRGQE